MKKVKRFEFYFMILEGIVGGALEFWPKFVGKPARLEVRTR
jgi:hypothetical protein